MSRLMSFMLSGFLNDIITENTPFGIRQEILLIFAVILEIPFIYNLRRECKSVLFTDFTSYLQCKNYRLPDMIFYFISTIRFTLNLW